MNRTSFNTDKLFQAKTLEALQQALVIKCEMTEDAW